MSVSLIDLLRGKKVLFIPVYSMRSYSTGKYDLRCDGNFARVMHVIFKSELFKPTVLLPSQHIMTSDSIDYIFQLLDRYNIYRYTSGIYGENAAATRANTSLAELDVNWLNHFDYIIVEPNLLPDALVNSGVNKDKIIYWCPVSKTANESANFLVQYHDTDISNSNNYTTVVCTEAQKQNGLSNSTIIDDDVYGAFVPETPIIYLPFRSSDKGYKIDLILHELYDLYKSGFNFKIFVADLNDSFDSIISRYLGLESRVVMVPKDRDLYYSILKSKPIIPILEDLDDILHQNIFEFNRFKCKTILMSGFKENRYNDNSIVISDLAYLKEALAGAIMSSELFA